MPGVVVGELVEDLQRPVMFRPGRGRALVVHKVNITMKISASQDYF
jgi:hypothetical protein